MTSSSLTTCTYASSFCWLSPTPSPFSLGTSLQVATSAPGIYRRCRHTIGLRGATEMLLGIGSSSSVSLASLSIGLPKAQPLPPSWSLLATNFVGIFAHSIAGTHRQNGRGIPDFALQLCRVDGPRGHARALQWGTGFSEDVSLQSIPAVPASLKARAGSFSSVTPSVPWPREWSSRSS